MRYLLAAALAVMLALPVAAQDFQNGVEAFRRGDYATALREWRPLAERGNATAQHNLGVMYDRGQGVPRDYVEAVKWYRKAAVQGDAPAQLNLGLLYEKGQGVPRDYVEAVKWYRKAAVQGNQWSQHDLGSMYFHGRGVPQDFVEAYIWLTLAATLGVEAAHVTRARMKARMTPAEILEAERLANTAASLGLLGKQWK